MEISSASTNFRRTARAQKCILVGKRGGGGSGGGGTGNEVLTRFPDQFSSFLSLPFGLQRDLSESGGFKGIMIRLPLRTVPSNISNNVTQISDIKATLRQFCYTLEGNLLFSRNLLSAYSLHWTPSDSEAKCDYELHLLSPPSSKEDRFAIMDDKGWKRVGFSSLFHKAFVPQVHSHTLTLSVKVHDVDVISNSG